MSLQSQSRTRLHDPGAELLDRVSGYWSSYGRMSLAVLGVIAAAAAIWFFTVRSRARSDEQAAGQLAEANLYYWQGDYARSAELAKRISEQFAGTASGTDALRIAGDDAYAVNDFRGAATYYKRYLDRQGKGVIPDAVRRSYAYALESGGQPAEAAPVYESLVGKFDRESSAEFLMAAARCYRSDGKPAEAVRRLERLTTEFGETSQTQRARIMLGELGAVH